MDFGSLSLTLLSSNHAQLAGDVVSFAGSTNSFDDGFGLQINGTFGPSSSISFNYTEITPGEFNFDSVAFTVGVSAVPEPSTLVLGLIGGAGMIAFGRRRMKAQVDTGTTT